MITIVIPEQEFFDDSSSTFTVHPERTLKLEHSLVAISKWESKWMKPFLGEGDKTVDEIYDYISCMVLNESEVDDHIIASLTQKNIDDITNYIKSPMTATIIKQRGSKANREVITSELIYYWMVSFNIPFECQYWHLNRLMMLVNICSIKNSPSKKESLRDTVSRNRELNAARRKALHSTG